MEFDSTEMYRPLDQERNVLHLLLKSSDLNCSLESSVSITSESSRRGLFGWRLVRPSAAYVITPHTASKRRSVSVHGIETPTERKSEQASIHTDYPRHSDDLSYMSGYIDENYSYVYKDGVSSKITNGRPSSLPTMYKCFPKVDLGPVFPYRHPDPNTQSDIAKIVAMQLKPELVVEQLIIENRLRTMSLTGFPKLNLEGVGISTKGERPSTKSGSAPLLRVAKKQSQHKEKKRKRRVRVPLEWCSFNPVSGSSPQLHQSKEDNGRDRLQQETENFQFNNFSYTQQPPIHTDHKPKTASQEHTPKHTTSQEQWQPSLASSKTSEYRTSIPTQPSISVVEPRLDSNILSSKKGGHYVHLASTGQSETGTLSSLLTLWKNTPVRL